MRKSREVFDNRAAAAGLVVAGSGLHDNAAVLTTLPAPAGAMRRSASHTGNSAVESVAPAARERRIE